MGGAEPESGAAQIPYAQAASVLARRAALAVLAWRAELAAARPRTGPARTGPVWIGIDGLGAAGKTTLARGVAGVLGGVRAGGGNLEVALVSVDDFARPGLDRWDHARFTHQILVPLTQGRPAHYQRWDHLADRGLDWVQVAADVDVVVVEGVSCTDSQVAVPWALRVWVEASAEVRMQRILRRDGPELLDVWLTDWIPNEQAYVAEQDPRGHADLVVATFVDDVDPDTRSPSDPIRPTLA